MLGWTIKKEELSKIQYNTAGFRSFVNRFADSGFRTKWSGLWTPPIKAFEYTAYSINGTWLSPDNAEECQIKPWGAKHYFDTDNLKITEILFCPKDEPAAVSILNIKNNSSSDKMIVIELEAAVNIRTKSENIHDRKYRTSANDLRSAIITESDIGTCIFGLGKTDEKPEIAYELKDTYKTHSPGSPQVCFIPTRYRTSFMLKAGREKKIPFIYCASTGRSDDLIHTFDRCSRKWKDMLEERIKGSIKTYHDHDIDTPDKRLDKAFLWAQFSQKSLINNSDVGTGIFAGYPWFLEYWGRDTFWSLFGLIDAGEFELSREMIKTLTKYQNKRIPCALHTDGSTEFHAADTDPLFLIILDRYEKASGDKTLKKELAKNIKESIKHLELLDYIAVHKPEETWMDTLKRDGSAVDIQALWTEALKTYEPRISMKMNTRLNRQFWNNDRQFYFDTHSRLPKSDATSNALVPLFFGLTPKDKANLALRRAKKELLCIYGIRTLSDRSRSYDPKGYHTGSCWGLTTGWGAKAFLNYGMTIEAIQCLDALAYDCERFEPGAFSETVSSDKGELLGTPHQAWSAALLIHAIDSGLFGIDPDMTKNTITIKPTLPDTWGHMYRHGKRINDNELDITIERTENGMDISLDFRHDPKDMRCELIPPKDIRKITINGKPTNAGTITFTAEKKNNIICQR